MHTFETNRRNLLRHGVGACMCFVGSGLFGARSALGQTAEVSESAALNVDEAFFICETTQITNIDLEPYAAESGNGTQDISVGDSTPDAPLTLDPYTTAQRQLRWRPQDVQTVRAGKPIVRIRFVGGSSWQQDEVRRLSQPWQELGLALGFEFVAESQRAEITISFAGTTNKSKTGREARPISYAGTPTMYLPAVSPQRPEQTRRRAVLHEFGHGVMTFGHEHRHADANFRFKSASYICNSINHLPGVSGWTVGMVQSNITNPPYSTERTCTAYDTTSIMHYPILADWLQQGTAVPVEATNLSRRDIECARIIYS